MRFFLPLLCLACTGAKAPPEDASETPTVEPAEPAVAAPIDATVEAGKAEFLRAALQANPDDPATHGDLARALSRLRQVESPCDHGAYLDEILDHLEIAVKANPRVAPALRGDPDFAPVATTVRFQLLTGLRLDNVAARSALLVSADWYDHPTVGLLPATMTLDLQEGGAAQGARIALGDAGPHSTPFACTWTPSDTGLRLSCEGKTQDLTLDPGGLLTEGGQPIWYNLPVECEA